MENELSGYDNVKAALLDYSNQGHFFSLDDTEELLTHDDPGEALEAHIENLFEPGDEAADIEGKILGNETFELFSYVRLETNEDVIRDAAQNAADAICEGWADEYGDPDGEHKLKVTPGIMATLVSAVQALYATEPVWRCEQVGPALELQSEDVLAWARVERKDWFE